MISAKRLLTTSLAKACQSARQASALHAPLSQLTEEEQMLKDAVRKFAQTEVKPYVMEMDNAKELKPEIIKSLFDNGFMGVEIPTEFQGTGSNFMSACLVIEELAKVDPSISVMVDVQNTLVGNALRRWGSDYLQKTYWPQLATKSVGCYCLSEAGSGSDAFALKTSAKKDGDDFLLNGTKMWITNSKEADIFIVFANAEPEKGYKGISAFILEKSFPGLTVGKREDKLGIRASSTCTVHMDNVRVPKSNVLGEFGKGYKYAIEILNEGRIGIAAQMVGLAHGALANALEHMRERQQFGQRLIDFQAMQHQMADAYLELEAARLLTYNAARKKEAGLPFIKDSAMAKLHASQVAGMCSSRAVEWMGGVGFVKEYPVEKFYRDAKIGVIYEGTSNMQRNLIAKFLDTEGIPE